MVIANNLDALLVFPSWADSNNKASYFSKMAALTPPLGLCILAAIAEKNGYKVGIVDGQVSNFSFDLLVDEVIKARPTLLGITSTSPFFSEAVKFARAIKMKTSDINIAIGGVHVTIAKEKAMLECFDFGFVGDSEVSFPAFLSWKNGGGGGKLFQMT